MVIVAESRTNLNNNSTNMSMSSAATSQHNRSMFLSPTSMGSLASPSAAAMASELELNWEPDKIRLELQSATIVLSHCCLKLAAKWASEHLLGFPWNNQKTETGSSSNISGVDQSVIMTILQENDPNVLYAKSLMELGEYMHAAAVLSLPNTTVTTMSPPLPELSPYGIFLRGYALFMAGERRKEEDYIELQSEAQKHSFVRNPYLSQLCQELKDAHQKHKLDAFGLYVYGMVLKEAEECKFPLTADDPPAFKILVESVTLFPCNWSAWLDLAAVSLKDSKVEKALEQILSPALGGHYMYHFFCAHLMSAHQSHDEALMLYDRLMEPQPGSPLFQSPYLVSMLGVLHYHLRQFGPARACFQQLHARDPFRMEDLDVYSNVLYVEEDRVSLSQLAHAAVKVDKYRPETCCVVGNYYSLKQQRHKAVLYFQRALKLDRHYMSAWTLMGHEYVELKNTAAAMEAYRRAVQLAPHDYRAWYGLGQTYEFLNMPLYALYYYRKAVTLRPFDSRMWCAMGLCYLALNRTNDAVRSYERAVHQGDAEGIATQKLAALYRQQGDTEQAAQCYLRHLELRYLVTHPHAQAPQSTGSTVAATGTNNNVSLDSIVQQVVVEAPEAEAMLFLASYHKQHGEYDTAALFCSRLLEYPGPEKEEAKAFLRELRSRKAQSQQTQRKIHTRSKGPPVPAWPMEEDSKDEDQGESSFEFSP